MTGSWCQGNSLRPSNAYDSGGHRNRSRTVQACGQIGVAMKTGCPPPRYGSRWTTGSAETAPKQQEGSPMECYVGLDVRREAEHRGGTVRTHHHPALPTEAHRGARGACRAEPPAHRTRGRARAPGLNPEPRAQITVWGRALRTATWGGQRPRMDAWCVPAECSGRFT